MSAKPDDVEEMIEISLQLVAEMSAEWDNFDDKKKASILSILADRIEIGEEGKNIPRIVWQPPWDVLSKISKILKNNSNPNSEGFKSTKGHTLIDNFKTLRFIIIKRSVKENIEQFRYALSN